MFSQNLCPAKVYVQFLIYQKIFFSPTKLKPAKIYVNYNNSKACLLNDQNLISNLQKKKIVQFKKTKKSHPKF